MSARRAAAGACLAGTDLADLGFTVEALRVAHPEQVVGQASGVVRHTADDVGAAPRTPPRRFGVALGGFEDGPQLAGQGVGVEIVGASDAEPTGDAQDDGQGEADA